MNLLKYAMGLAVAVALTACGGGGGSAGTPIGSPSPAASAPASSATAATAASFVFTLDKSSISNAGSDKALLTVTALDASRNVVSGVPVSVSVDSGAYTPVTGTTDTTGQVSGNISIGGNKANRTINATINVGGQIGTAAVTVTGSQISLTANPAAPAPGQLVTLSFAMTDSANSPIANASAKLTKIDGSSVVITTDSQGGPVGVVTFNAPSTAGTYQVLATGLGITTTKIIQVIAPNGNTIPAAVGSVVAASLTPQVSTISAFTSGCTTPCRTKLSAKFLQAGNAAIKDMRVRFVIVPPALGSGEAISVGDGTVYTDSSGIAEADYIAGTRGSPTNGVNVRACYKATDFVDSDFTPDGLCPALTGSNSGFTSTSLTVASLPLSISIGDDNLLAKGLGAIAYVKKFLVQVNDSAGVAVKDAVVSTSVDITHYGKGVYGGVYPLGLNPPTVKNLTLAVAEVTPATNPVTYHIVTDNLTSNPIDLTATNTAPGAPATLIDGTPTTYNVWCVNEDRNRNASLDTGEDTNNDGKLQPSKAEIIVSYVNGNKTDANGQLLLQVTYGQNMGRWLAYTVRATTSVEGSEGDASKSYITDVLKEDEVNGSFRTPPFGSAACSSRF